MYKPSTGSINLNEYDHYQFGSDRTRIVTGVIAPIEEGKDNETTLDPLKKGYVKVQIDGVNDELDPKLIPWAIPIHHLGTGSEQGFGHFSVPAPGTRVVALQGADEYTYYILGEHPSEKRKALDKYSEDYPDAWGMTDRSGNFSKINMKKGYALFQHSSGSLAKVVASGTINVKGVDDLNIDIADNGEYKYGGYMKEDIAEHYEFKSGSYAKIQVGDYLDMKVSADGLIDINGSMMLTVHADGTIGVTGNLTIASGSNISINAGSNVDISASKINLDGDVDIGSKVKIHGQVDLDGSVKINGVTQVGD